MSWTALSLLLLTAVEPGPKKELTVYCLAAQMPRPSARLKQELVQGTLKKKVARSEWIVNVVQSDRKTDRALGITMHPTTIARVNGKEVGRKEGYTTAKDFAVWLLLLPVGQDDDE